jgi:transcriptional regulator with XRE-family HTH domain
MANGNGVDPVAVEMGRRIAELRVARDWTQRELAQATGWNEQDADDSAAKGLSPSRIANYEQGTAESAMKRPKS